MTTTALATGKLGKLPVRTDVRTLRLKRYVDETKLPAPPPALDLTAHVAEWPMYANDRRGDCTTAAAGHMIEAWTAAAAGEAVEISESAVLRAFCSFTHARAFGPVTSSSHRWGSASSPAYAGHARATTASPTNNKLHGANRYRRCAR